MDPASDKKDLCEAFLNMFTILHELKDSLKYFWYKKEYYFILLDNIWDFYTEKRQFVHIIHFSSVNIPILQYNINYTEYLSLSWYRWL